MRAVGRDLRTLLSAGAVGRLSDGQLLDWFLTRQEEAAFAELVRRHGPMVMGVCRRGLGNHHDAEDAFQATFLVLARNGAMVQPRERLAHWLHGVAWRIARKARIAAGKRRARERLVADVPEPASPVDDTWADLVRVLDQELRRLPERYRAPVVLCDLEGQGRKQAAQQLGWPEGTLSSRLSRARALLAQRLKRRGITLSGGALAALLSENGASAAVPASLVSSTAKIATFFAVGSAATATVASAEVLTLTERMLQAMLVSKVKVMTALLAVSLTVLGAGAAGLAGQGEGKEPVQTGSNGLPSPPASIMVEGPATFEFVKKDDGYLGHIVRANKNDPPVEITIGDDGVKLHHADPKTLPLDQREFRRWMDWAKQLEEAHRQKGRAAVTWASRDCQTCHLGVEKRRPELGNVEFTERERNQVVRDVLVRQALRDIEATLKRLEQDMPDRRTELEALDQIEAAVRALKEKARERKN